MNYPNTYNGLKWKFTIISQDLVCLHGSISGLIWSPSCDYSQMVSGPGVIWKLYWLTILNGFSIYMSCTSAGLAETVEVQSVTSPHTQASSYMVMLSVAPRGRRFPYWGKFAMNSMRPNEGKGKCRLEIKGLFYHGLVSLSHGALCPILLNSSPPATSFQPQCTPHFSFLLSLGGTPWVSP